MPAGCAAFAASLQPAQALFRESGMTAILTIVIFLAVFAGLNWFEFGRLD
jgi:hypothetical protein